MRHGPPPSTNVAKPIITFSTKTSFHQTPYSALIKSADRSNIFLNTNDTLISNSEPGLSRSLPLNSLIVKSDNTFESKTDKISVLSVLPKSAENAQSHFVHDTPLHPENTDFKQYKNNLKSCSKNVKIYTDDIRVNYHSDIEKLNKSDSRLKTSESSFYLKDSDPFDTSKVFTPSFLQPTIFQTANASLSINSNISSYAFNSTSCSAHPKVNAINRYIFHL